MTQFIMIIKGFEPSRFESFYYFTFYGMLNSYYLYKRSQHLSLDLVAHERKIIWILRHVLKNEIAF